MKKYLILLSFIVLSLVSSCGAKDKKFDNIDPNLAPLINEYKSQLSDKLKLPKISIAPRLTAGFSDKFDDTETVGICKSWYDNDSEIEILKSFWEKSDEKTRAVLVWHEVTHCVCNRNHTHAGGAYPEPKDGLFSLTGLSGAELEKKGYFSDFCPTSIMHPYILSHYCIVKHWDHYKLEMLEGCELSD